MLYIPTADIQTVAEAAPLGECCGQLYDSNNETQYITAGGAIYPKVVIPGAVRTTQQQQKQKGNSNSSVNNRESSSSPSPSRLRSPTGNEQADEYLRLMSYVARPLKYITGAPKPRVNAILEQRRAKSTVGAMAFHPHAMLLAVSVSSQHSDECTIHIYDVSTSDFKRQTLVHGFQKKVTVLQWKPKSKAVLAVGCQGGALVWDLNFTIQACQSFTVQQLTERRRLMGTRFVPGRDAPELFQALPEELHEVEDGAALFYPLGGAGSANTVVSQLTFSHHSGRFLAIGAADHQYLKVYDMSTAPNNALVASLTSLEGGPRALSFSADDRYLVMAPHCTSKIRVWNTSTWRGHEFWTSGEVTAIEPLPVLFMTDYNDFYWNSDVLKGHQGSQFLVAMANVEGLAIVEVRKVSLDPAADMQVAAGDDDEAPGLISSATGFVSKQAGRLMNIVGVAVGADTQLKLVGRISLNGLVAGQSVGGCVLNMAAHLCSTNSEQTPGARVTCELEDGNVVTFHISHATSRTVASRSGIKLDHSSVHPVGQATVTSIPATNYFVRGIGVFNQYTTLLESNVAQARRQAGGGANLAPSSIDDPSGHGIVAMTYFPGFQLGSLLAILLTTGEIQFIPSYYRSG